MKRADIEKLFEGKLAEGIEAKELIDQIMKFNGDDINSAKETAQKSAADDIEKIKQEAVNEALKPYQEGGEKYINPEDYNKAVEEIKAYKERDTKAAQEKVFDKLLADGKFDTKATKLLRKTIPDYEPHFNENNELENASEILEKMKADYPSFIVTEKDSGFVPAKPVATTQNDHEGDAFYEGLMNG